MYIRPQLDGVMDQIPPNISRSNRSSLTGWDLTHSSWSLSCVNFDLLMNQPTFTGMIWTHQWLFVYVFHLCTHSFHVISCHVMPCFNSIQFMYACNQSNQWNQSIKSSDIFPKFPTQKKSTSTSDKFKISQQKTPNSCGTDHVISPPRSPRSRSKS